MGRQLPTARTPAGILKFALPGGQERSGATAAPTVEPGATQRLVKKLFQMGFWRMASIAAAAAGGIWTTRCMGPQKLGISGMATAFYSQAALLVQFGLTPQLVREYKSDQHGPAGNERLVSETLSYRLGCALLLSAIWAAIALCLKLPVNWWLSTTMGMAMLVANAGTCDWLLQAQEDQVAQQRIAAIGAVGSALLSFALLRHTSPAGSDLVINAAVAITIGVLMWRAAMPQKHQPSISLSMARQGLNRLWRGRYLFLSAIVIYCYTCLEWPLIGWLRSVEELGRYRSAIQVVGAVQPLLALLPALLYPRMIEWSKLGAGHLWEKQLNVAKVILLLSVPAIVATFVVVPMTYPYVFGERFRDAALPCCFLIASKFVVLLNGIFGWGLWALGKDRTMLVIMSITAALSLLLNLLLIPRFGMLGASIINIGSEVLILVACMVFSYRAALPGAIAGGGAGPLASDAYSEAGDDASLPPDASNLPEV